MKISDVPRKTTGVKLTITIEQVNTFQYFGFKSYTPAGPQKIICARYEFLMNNIFFA